MKKLNNNNNKFRVNGNTIYSLNYKFDSVSSAGKLSGTALDLIKRYNELAKEAHNNGDYVQMEVFRQYAEHYRKIVTEINERKNQNRENAQQEQQNNGVENQNEQPTQTVQPEQNNLVETEAAAPTPVAESVKAEEKPRRRRSFTVIDVAAKENSAVKENKNPTENLDAERTVTEEKAPEADNAETAEKPHRRTITRRRLVKKSENSETSVAEN